MRACVRACVRASVFFWGLAYYQGKDIVLRPIREYSSLRDFYRPQGNNNNNNNNNNRSIFIEYSSLRDFYRPLGNNNNNNNNRSIFI